MGRCLFDGLVNCLFQRCRDQSLKGPTFEQSSADDALTRNKLFFFFNRDNFFAKEAKLKNWKRNRKCRFKILGSVLLFVVFTISTQYN